MGMNCALDGPAGAGKSTVAKELAKKLGYIYVDTGALYRAVGYYALSKGADTTSADDVVPLLGEINVELKFENGVQAVYLNGENVSDKIRTPEMSMAASNVSAIPAVRAFLLDLQRSIAANNDIIMDGRDIGTVILPNAQVKIFLTASIEERAKRRYDELIAKGQDVNYEDIKADIAQRDYNDSHRATAPLKKADDAIEVDTSDMTIEEVIETVANIIESKKFKAPESNIADKKPKCSFRLVGYTIIRWIVKVFIHIAFNVKIVNKQNIPHAGGCVIASNHISWADGLIIGINPIVSGSYVSKAELFKNPLVAFLLNLLNCFPVLRGKGDMGFVTISCDFLNKGHNVIIFPEGTRSKTGEIGRAKTGVAYIAAASKAPIIPVSVKCDGKVKFRSKITVTFGDPIYYPQLGISGTSPSEMHKVRDIIMNKIKEQLDD